VGFAPTPPSIPASGSTRSSGRNTRSGSPSTRRPTRPLARPVRRC